MSTGVRLTLLRCPECASNLAGEKEGVFLYCARCGSGFHVENDRLQKVPVYFARMTPAAKEFYPFWAFDATLEVRSVETKKGILSYFQDRGGLFRVFGERGAIRMYVPAFPGDLDAERPVSLQLTLDQPQLEFIAPRPEIRGFTIALEDAHNVADFLLMTSEIQQSDMMRKLDYTLHLSNPMVVVVGW